MASNMQQSTSWLKDIDGLFFKVAHRTFCNIGPRVYSCCNHSVDDVIDSM